MNFNIKYYKNKSEKENATAVYLVHLLKSVLLDEKPFEKPENVSFEDVFKLAKAHSVDAMAWYGIERLDKIPDAELSLKWEEEREKNIKISFNQINERDIIIDAVTKNGIDIIPLKGAVLKEDYPQLDYRQMGDLDFLIHFEDAKKLQGILDGLGYAARELWEDYFHDEYLKKFINVEMHKELIFSEARFKYYKTFDPWTSANKSENENLFYMNENDFYIYLIAHFANHYFSNGSGIRSIMDIYVFLKKYGDKIDRDYINSALEQMDLLEFTNNAEKIADVWFGNSDSFDESALTMSGLVLSSGVFGNSDISVQIALEEGKKKSKGFSKTRLVLRNLFPGNEVLARYPFFNQHRIFYPIFIFYHLFRNLKINKDKAKSIAKTIIKKDD